MKPKIGLMIGLLFLGCTLSPKIKVTYWATERFLPTNKVEVFKQFPAQKNFLEVAEIAVELDKVSKKRAVMYLAQKAQELGADAIVLRGERQVRAYAIPVGATAIPVPVKALYAIAIKYQK